jgi:threonine synthase
VRLRAYRCVRCGSTFAPDATRWRCDCGGWLDLDRDGAGDAPEPVRLGTWPTPEVDVVIEGRRLRAKVEHEGPTRSFKDRGAEVLVGLAVAVGAEALVADSSGNAGAALAAHAAVAGLPLTVFVAGSTSPSKLARITRHGAAVVPVGGTREDVATAAIGRVEASGAFYASHVYNPWFWEGTANMVLELDPLPDTLLLPYGNGTLVLGARSALRHLGAVDRCRIVAVRAATIPTVAEGIAIASPARDAEVRAAVDRVVTVEDDEILTAQAELAQQGRFVEPTAAACFAGARWLTDDDGSVVAPLSGAGSS